MKAYKNDKEKSLQQLSEDSPVYGASDAQDEARLREAVNRTDTEKFRFLMTLMKINRVMSKAIIHHKTDH